MNTHLFLSIIAWGVVLTSGAVLLHGFLLILGAILTPGGKVTISWPFFATIFIFLVSLAYLIAS
jgi:hypothetical protein